ncbi:MAG: di-trans,poly-cis-decaprenylcistransferase [Methanomicrobiales archaeon]|nr:di-trans,poly-cis-decaprenylcistransferase [Methanomicrobiales archaeon]
MLRSAIERLYARYLLWQVRHLPRHVAVIQDGNRRFARDQGIDTATGHKLGADTTEQVLDWACELGVRHITLYTFSTENFRRNRDELASLFTLFQKKFIAILTDERVHRNHIRVQMIGDRSLLPDDLLATVEAAEKATLHYTDYFINVALAYGGRNEIVHAARSILDEVKTGLIDPGVINPMTVENHLNRGAPIPPVDLIIRTGNDYRTSNFLPWLANGHESAVYFCAPYWPAFRKIDLLRAMRVYDQRMYLKA